MLFDKLGLSKKRRGKTGFSTDARVLAAIRDEHEIIAKVEQWRELTKLKSTYLDALPELIRESTGRLHTTFNQTATTTGRLSSTNPNLQNIPIRSEEGREIRACFVAEEGYRLISADYSQIELRVLAHLADEEVLKDLFARGEDIHAATAGEMFGLAPEQVDHGTRSKAKMINFGIVYGLSAYGLADRLQIPQEEAAEFIERYLNRFPKVQQFITQDDHRRDRRGLRHHDVRPHPAHPRAARAPAPDAPAGRAAGDQHGGPGQRRRHHQGGDGALLEAPARRGPRHPARAADPRRAAVRGPRAEVERATAIVREEMVRAYALDPPLAVDVGVGVNWLDAK